MKDNQNHINDIFRCQIKEAFYKSSDLVEKHGGHYSYVFKRYYPDLYDAIFKITSFADKQKPAFRARIALILHDSYSIPICQHEDCNNEANISNIRPNDPIPIFCCSKCYHTASITRKRISDTIKNFSPEKKEARRQKTADTFNKIIADNPNYWKERAERSAKTKEERYGDPNYMSFGSESWYQMNEKKNGNRYYTNTEKAKETNRNKSDAQKQAEIEKRVNSFNAHKEADPNFVKNMVEKSKATRIANNGEDYTGRKKCKQTMIERYGVENAFQTDIAKEQSKKTNLERYGVEYYSQTDEYSIKVKETSQEKYGADNYSQTEECKAKIQQTNLIKYGVKCSFQADEVKEKIAQTNLERYGVENAMQNPDIRRKAQKKYFYDGFHFDSFPEIAYYVWLKDNNISFEYQPDVSFEYSCNEIVHKYIPDFMVEGQYVELKGLQFFEDKDPSKKMINPYDHNQDDVYEAKHQCMIKNNVMIMTDIDFNKYIEYAKKKFTSDEIKMMRTAQMR